MSAVGHFPSRGGEEKFGAHMDNCSRSHLSSPGSTGVGELEFKDLGYSLFPAAQEWSVLKEDSNIG